MNSTTTKIYLYHQRHRVVLLDTSGAYFDRRYRQVYTKNLIAHRGTDNQILIEFVNQDQKRVPLSRTSYGATVAASAIVPGTDYKIVSVGTCGNETDFTLIGAPNNNTCTVFTATDGTAHAGDFVVGVEYQITVTADTDFTLIGAADSNVGTIFVATGPGTGCGQAIATQAGTGDGTATTIVYTDLTFTCRLISHDGEKLLLEKPLEVVSATAGQTKLVLTEQELDLIAPGKVGWSIEQTTNGILNEPVYVDDHSGGRGVMNITDSIMPAFIDSEILTIPAQTIVPPDYVSSILNTDATDLITFQFTMDQFTGDIIVQGAADVDDNWYTIQTEHLAASDLHLFNIEGFHPYIRFYMPETLLATDLVAGGEYEIVTAGTTDFTLIGWDGVSATFIATGPGTGDGTVKAVTWGTITEIRHR